MAIGLQTALVNQNRLPSVREMQCRLLVSLSGTEDIATTADESIRELADGRRRHRYAALSLGFRLAVEKRRNPSAETTSTMVPLPPGPTLQCPNPNCSRRGIPVFVRDISGTAACQTCRWGFKCCVCGCRPKRGSIQSCGGCKRDWN